MKVDYLYWNSARVTCQSDPSKSLTLGRCYVEFVDGFLHIRERDGTSPKGVSYIKASVVRLDMAGATFSACWFSHTFDGSRPDEVIPVDVACEF